jgi:hypothetical protein
MYWEARICWQDHRKYEITHKKTNGDVGEYDRSFIDGMISAEEDIMTVIGRIVNESTLNNKWHKPRKMRVSVGCYDNRDQYNPRWVERVNIGTITCKHFKE